MKHLFTVIYILLGSIPIAEAQTSYSWASYPTRCTGVGVYTQPNMTVDVTGSGFANYGPQSAASACAATSGNRYYSPKYVTSPNGSAPDWQYNGLALGVDWPNTSSNATVVITFTTPVCGPLTFSIYDINSGTWGGYNPVWRDRVTLSGTNSGGATIYPSSISGCANNTVGGANSNIISAGLNTGCTNGTHLITFNSATIKTLTIVYNSLAIDGTYGTDPDPEYIIIGNISTTTCVLPLERMDFKSSCDDQQPLLQWNTAAGPEADYFEIMRSSDNETFDFAGRVEAESLGNKSNQYSWTDPRPVAKEVLYKIRMVNQDGSTFESPSIPGSPGCFSGLTLGIFPNPARDLFMVECGSSGSDKVFLEILDASGRTVFQTESNGTESADGFFSLELNPASWAPGIYAVKASCNNEVVMKRLVVE